ncbi:tetratricopeptide repeat protein [Dictyobacter arantiisoli]|uniref:Uncharacterized protein n=1 Tax=Dictyobacter arantiisoli TaxID=2014874 RepID=A0A5A5TK08_9CHLR|nr:tetratricopeptide repeat protein [Dictyobacter arantiisoli]GCF11224.1 hypothetical protein KDI_47880 [Dictyobacter arantiisoli]
MDTPDLREPFQYLGQATNSAVTNSGTANNYNFQDGQHQHHHYAPAKAWTPPMMLPPRAQFFVGREDDLAWLLDQLQSDTGRTLALCGPGGMGKTALAAESLNRLIDQEDWLERFPGGIFYHSFYATPSLAIAFEQLALLFNEEVGADPYRAALRALSRRRTLLVFDGLEVLEDTQPLRQIGGKHIIILLSRRQSDAPDVTHRRTLELLSPQQGRDLLQQLAGPRATDQHSVERLVTHIGGFPLALQLIGSYLSSRQEDVAVYLQRFEQTGLPSLHHGDHQNQSVQRVLHYTYASLTPREQQLFILLGLLAPAPFPLELIAGIVDDDALSLQEMLGSLVNLSLLRRPGENYEVSHPLVHTYASMLRQTKMETRTTFPWWQRVLSWPRKKDVLSGFVMDWQDRLMAILIAHFAQSDPYDRVSLPLWQPHVLPLLSTEHLSTDQLLRTARLFTTVGFAVFTQGKYAEAEPLCKRALAIREEHLGARHPATANSLNNLAALYRAQGKYADAEPLYKRALAIREEQLGARHPATANSLNNLAALYNAQGKYADAEPLYKRALAIREEHLGARHPATATSLNNLAELYRAQGKYADAEPLYRRALAIHEEQLGARHPDTASILNNLALFYAEQGKYEEAEPLYKRALAIHEEQLGGNHPATASILNNLASLYRAQGEHAEAEPLYRRALAIHEEHLGARHPDTALSLNNLAALYRAQGKYADAEPLYKRALAIYEVHLGARHPDTANSLNNLAAFYHNQGKYAEAEPLYKRALAIREEQLGGNHPATASILNNLASLYRAQGEHAEAEPLYKRALAIYEEQLGARHPATATSLNNLAELYHNQGKYGEAEPLYKRALAIIVQRLGESHPDTQTIAANYAALLEAMKSDEK